MYWVIEPNDKSHVYGTGIVAYKNFYDASHFYDIAADTIYFYLGV